ncbi:MAG: thioesterase family protein [Planctomycetota bacterium]
MSEAAPFVVYRAERRVEFRDTDAAGIVHFSAFFPMMEAAEHEFLRSIGMTVMPPPDADPRVTFPRVAAACDYMGPARFEDALTIDVSVERIGRSSISYRFDIRCDTRMIALGRLTVVCCHLTDGGTLTKVDVPDALRAALRNPSSN